MGSLRRVRTDRDGTERATEAGRVTGRVQDRAQDRLAWPAAALVIIGLSLLAWIALAVAIRAVL